MRPTASRISATLLTALVLSTFAFANPQKEFDRDQAAKAIAEGENFKDCHTGMNNWDACLWNIYTGPWESISAYWGAPHTQLQPDILKANPVGYWLYKQKGYLQLSASPQLVTLSDRGKVAAKSWTPVALPVAPASRANAHLERWEVPLATKKFIAIKEVFRGERMGVPFADVTYTWEYSLTPLGEELLSNDRIPSTRTAAGWSRPSDLMGIALNATHEDKATFYFYKDEWRLQEECRGDTC
jgi:hypothetical protein